MWIFTESYSLPCIVEKLPSTNDVNKVTLAAFLLPAGKFKPMFSNFSLSSLPPFFDLALQIIQKYKLIKSV